MPPVAARLCLLGLILVGCKTVYVPNLVNAPLLSEKDELRASISPNNVQAAYALTDNVGVIGNAYYESKEPDERDNSGQGGHGYLAELGAGYFVTRPAVPGFPILEVYGGLGYGHVEHDNWDTVGGMRRPYRYEVSAVKLFAQPTAGWTFDWLDVAFSARLVGMKAFGVTATNYPEERLREDDLFELDRPFWTFVEPAVTLRAGWRWAKAFMQYGYSLKANDEALSRKITFLYFGLHFTMAPRF